MELSQTYSIKTLLVFENTINKELIRSLHVYRLEDGKEKEVEREFVFRRDGPYVEMAANPLLGLQKFLVSELFHGRVTGLWLCIFAFHADRLPRSFPIPPVLSISGNPKLKSIRNLADDLQMIFRCGGGVEDERISGVSTEDTFEENQNHSSRSLPVFDQDLNCPPNSVSALELSENQKGEKSTKGMIMMKKRKRATSKDVSRISIEDLAKYFDVPIVEASKSLKIGVTVLKKRCRELGIPRWPHRKIKSLDGLIRDLQEEAAQWQHDDEAAAFAVAKRRMMLETEKEIIERKPFIELQRETKQFRQDVFKRRHKARALKNQDIEVLNTDTT